MMIQEFEERTGFHPSMELYTEIEKAYIESNLDKDAFCKDYKQNKNGIAEAIARKYYLDVKKVYDIPGIDPETIKRNVYPGTGRSQALKDFAAYQKSHPGIIAVKDIEKGKWER